MKLYFVIGLLLSLPLVSAAVKASAIRQPDGSLKILPVDEAIWDQEAFGYVEKN